MDVCRADEEESLREVAISAMAIDKMIGEEPKDAKADQVLKVEEGMLALLHHSHILEVHLYRYVSHYTDD
mgnify:CR=1